MTQAVRHDAMRAGNLRIVLDAVRHGGPLTRAALAEATGLTKSTVSKLVGDLVDAGLLAETGVSRAGERGRPGVDVVLSGARVASLGLEVNVDYLAACVLDLTGSVRFTARSERDNRGSRPARVLADLQVLAEKAFAEARGLGLDVAGAAVALSGPVGDGVLFSAPNLGWPDVRVAELLRLPVPVELDNEANLAALGELWFGGGERNFLYVSGEIGIGAGLVVNGELYRGATGLAGELGHVIVSPDGPPCRCGGSGCLETYAGQEALLAGTSSPAEFAARLADDDPAALAACASAGRALGIALTSAVNLLDLDHIVLGGVFAPLFGWLADPVREVLSARLGALRGSVPLVTGSRLGVEAATLGAAGRIIDRVLADPAAYVSRPA